MTYGFFEIEMAYIVLQRNIGFIMLKIKQNLNLFERQKSLRFLKCRRTRNEVQYCTEKFMRESFPLYIHTRRSRINNFLKV